MTATIETYNVELAHQEALQAANTAAQEFANSHFNGGDGGACGFSWVDVYGVRSNSKLGRPCRQWASVRATQAPCNCGTSGTWARALMLAEQVQTPTLHC